MDRPTMNCKRMNVTQVEQGVPRKYVVVVFSRRPSKYQPTFIKILLQADSNAREDRSRHMQIRAEKLSTSIYTSGLLCKTFQLYTTVQILPPGPARPFAHCQCHNDTASLSYKCYNSFNMLQPWTVTVSTFTQPGVVMLQR